jgi:hypothetical protein
METLFKTKGLSLKVKSVKENKNKKESKHPIENILNNLSKLKTPDIPKQSHNSQNSLIKDQLLALKKSLEKDLITTLNTPLKINITLLINKNNKKKMTQSQFPKSSETDTKSPIKI